MEKEIQDRYVVIRGPRSFRLMEDSYQEIVWGYEEPDILRCGPYFVPWFYDEVARLQAGVEWGKDGPQRSYPGIPKFHQCAGRIHHFNNCTMCIDRYCAMNVFFFENSKHPEDPKFNCMVEFYQ